MDSNHDKQIQNLLCYRYTTRQIDPLKHWLYGLFPKSSPNEACEQTFKQRRREGDHAPATTVGQSLSEFFKFPYHLQRIATKRIHVVQELADI